MQLVIGVVNKRTGGTRNKPELNLTANLTATKGRVRFLSYVNVEARGIAGSYRQVQFNPKNKARSITGNFSGKIQARTSSAFSESTD